MKNVFAFLAVLFLAVVAFGQVDSADQAAIATIRQIKKPVDTTLTYETFRLTKTIPRNRTIKLRIAGTSMDTVILRVIDTRPKPLLSGDTLRVDSITCFIKMEVREIYGLRSTGGLISQGGDSTIILNAPAMR
jgi:hypothetical protein